MTSPDDSENSQSDLVKRFRGSEDLPEAELEEVERVIQQKDSVSVPGDLLREEKPTALEASTDVVKQAAVDPDKLDLRTALSKMTLPQKMKLAMFGNAICRGLLIRDSNKLIQLSVLKNPKLGEGEVEEFSKNTNLSDHVLRMIAHTQMWTKNYSVKRNLVNNPKTPLDISIKWIKFMTLDDIKKISKSKSISQVIVNLAKKRISEERDKK